MLIDRRGIVKAGEISDEPFDRDSVDRCKSILKYVKERDYFPKDAASYTYKHMIQKMFSEYVSNGDFIQAAFELNFEIKELDFDENLILLMVYFKFTKSDFYLAQMQYDIVENNYQSELLIHQFKEVEEVLCLDNKVKYWDIKDIVALFNGVGINLKKKDIYLMLNFKNEDSVFDWSHHSGTLLSLDEIASSVKVRLNNNLMETVISKFGAPKKM